MKSKPCSAKSRSRKERSHEQIHPHPHRRRPDVSGRLVGSPRPKTPYCSANNHAPGWKSAARSFHFMQFHAKSYSKTNTRFMGGMLRRRGGQTIRKPKAEPASFGWFGFRFSLAKNSYFGQIATLSSGGCKSFTSPTNPNKIKGLSAFPSLPLPPGISVAQGRRARRAGCPVRCFAGGRSTSRD
jgi:hypothetical protein